MPRWATSRTPRQTPAAPGSSLVKGEPEEHVSHRIQKEFRKGVGKLLHLTRWTRPEIMNSVRELSRHMSGAVLAHLNAMCRVMAHCVATPLRGLKLIPNEIWNGNPLFEFIVSGRADSDYAKDLETRGQRCFSRNILSWTLHGAVSLPCRFSTPHQPLGRFPTGRFE